MFGYLRNIYSSNPPEVFTKPIADDIFAYEGELLQLKNRVLSKGYTKGAPIFLALEEKAEGDGKKEISVIRLTSGMVLSATISYSDTAEVGDLCTFLYDEDGNTINIAASGTDCEVIAKPDDFSAIIIVN